MADSIDDFLLGKTDTAAPTAAPSADSIDRFLLGTPAPTTQPAPTPQAAAPPPDATPSPTAGLVGDVAGTIGSFTKGMSFGGDNLLDRATSYLFPNSGFAQMQPQFQTAQKDFETTHPLAASAAQVAGSLPTYMMGEGALRAAVPIAQGSGAVPFVANLAGSAVRNAAVSGVEAAGEADGSLADRAAAAERGATVGAVAGPLGDLATRTLTGGLGGISPADAKLGQLAQQKYNIPIPATDLTGNSLYRIANDQLSRLPFSGAAGADATKRAAWQTAIVKEMGENAPAFTDDVMHDAATRISQDFNNVAQHTTIDPASTNIMTNDLAHIEASAHQILPANELGPIKAQLDNIIDVAAKGNGSITGDSYQALTRTGSPLDRAESSGDPNVKYVAGQIRDALDDAFQRSASPADQATLSKARYQWRVMKTVEPLAAGSRDGNISPDAFMQKVLTASRRFDSSTGGMAYTGGGNVGELARIGKLMRAPPQTGTADRMLINSLTLGGGVGAAGFINPAYAAGVPAALAANRLGGAYLRSNFLANRLIGNTLNPAMRYAMPSAPAAVAGGVNALNPP